MTQVSRPAAEHIANFPTSDAGPYSADEWALLFMSLFSGDQQATQGPLVRYLNELEVTLFDAGPPAVFRVDTGAAMVNGHWFHNDDEVDFTIVPPAGDPRIDRVVVAVNNTALLYTVSDLGFALDFPDDLTDYNGTASIEPYSCRLCIVQGVEAVGPVAPGLDQNNNHFMIPLYQYEIEIDDDIIDEVDDRVFCRFSTGYGERYLNMPAISCYNITDGNLEPFDEDGWDMVDAKQCQTFGAVRVPIGYDGTYTIEAMLRPEGTGNLRWRGWTYRARCADNTHPATSDGWWTTAVTSGVWECLDMGTQAVVAGDMLTAVFERAANGLDTVGATVRFKAFLITSASKLL